MDDKPTDYPFEEMLKAAQAKIDKGVLVYQKFTCSGCGARLMIPEPNEFHGEADCEICGAWTNIREQGCNYQCVLVMHIGGGNGAAKGQSDDNS